MTSVLWNERSKKIPKELLILEKLEKAIKTDDIIRFRVQSTRCQNRWLNNCFNGKCPAFRVYNGNYYCKEDLG